MGNLFEKLQRILEAKNNTADGVSTYPAALGNVVFESLFVQLLHASYSFHVLNNCHTPVAARKTKFLIGVCEENKNTAYVLSIVEMIFFIFLSALKKCIG